MARLTWDATGERFYETGVSRGVLYLRGEGGTYPEGVVWNGLISVTESPSGAEPNPQYADNIKYLNLVSAEEFAATIEAYTYPDEFAEADGSKEPLPGMKIGQQNRTTFGLSYQTKVGNDTEGQNLGYKIHLVYGATAAPSEKAYQTINDSPEAVTFSWELSTDPVSVPGFEPTASITFDSRELTESQLETLEEVLYGNETTEASLPLPAELIAMLNV